jgi:hypothetical protein
VTIVLPREEMAVVAIQKSAMAKKPSIIVRTSSLPLAYGGYVVVDAVFGELICQQLGVRFAQSSKNIRMNRSCGNKLVRQRRARDRTSSVCPTAAAVPRSDRRPLEPRERTHSACPAMRSCSEF